MYTIYTKIRINKKFKVMGAVTTTISIKHHAPTTLFLFSLLQPCLFIHEEAHKKKKEKKWKYDNYFRTAKIRILKIILLLKGI